MNTEHLHKHFPILDIPPNSAFETVKSAYRDLVKVWHPDRFTDSPALQHRAQEKLKAINLAYTALGEAFQNEIGQARPMPKPQPNPKPMVNDGAWLVETMLYAIKEGRTTERQRQAYFTAVEAYEGHDSLVRAILPALRELAILQVTGNVKNQLGRFFKDARIAWSSARDKSDYPPIIARWILDNAALTPEFTQRRTAFVSQVVTNARPSQ